MYDILVLGSNLTCNNIEAIVNSSIFHIEENKLVINKYIRVRENMLLEDIENLIKNNKLKGEIYISKIQNEKHIEGKYILKKKKIEFQQCKLQIIPRNCMKSDKKRMSEQEKKDLTIEFLTTYGRQPDLKELYKDFNVGTFFHSVLKWGNVYNIVKETLDKI